MAQLEFVRWKGRCFGYVPMLTLSSAPFCILLASGIARLGFPCREEPPPGSHPSIESSSRLLERAHSAAAAAGGLAGGVACLSN